MWGAIQIFQIPTCKNIKFKAPRFPNKCTLHLLLSNKLLFSFKYGMRILGSPNIMHPARLAKRSVFQTHDLVVVSSIPSCGELFSRVFSPLTSAEACEKSSRWLWKEKLCWYWCEKARKDIMCH